MAFKFLSILALVVAAVRAETSSHLIYAGVNIAGFDFGCWPDGTASADGAVPPLKEQTGIDGVGQMQHFAKDDGYNMFRLPVSWQYLTDNQMTGTLNDARFANYNELVRACLDTDSSCIVDLHNYARFDGQIIGQGGPSNEIFAELWSNIANHWKDEPKIFFAIMNEPHDLDIGIWAETVQAAVTAIRSTGASQVILLSGTNWSSAATFISSGSAEALSQVKNPDDTTHNIWFDVHMYLDDGGAGTGAECVTDNIVIAWDPLSTWLRNNGRYALNTETGGGNTDSCVQFLYQQLRYQFENCDVILGYVGWAAGSFATDYVLSETPTFNGTGWVDQKVVSEVLSPATNRIAGNI